MNEHVRELYEEMKYKLQFPPRAEAASVKGALAARGLAMSGVLAQRIVDVYLKNLEKVLDEFASQILNSHIALGLNSLAEARQAISDAYQQLFDEARGVLIGEFPGGSGNSFGMTAMGLFDARRLPIWEHLDRNLNLKWRERSAIQTVAPKEREQKFGILLSPKQAPPDFESFAAEAREWGNPIAILFVDFDHFKALNERLTETKVDQTILPEAQKLLARLVQSRGEAYRYGGEEFLMIMPNLDSKEARAFAEKVREAFEQYSFQVEEKVERFTVSIGVALWPDNGDTYEKVLAAANRAEANAKSERNTVKTAGEQ